MRRFGGLNVSAKVNQQDPASQDRGRSKSPKGMRDWRNHSEANSSGRELGRFVSPTAAQDAAILQSVWGDDVKIRQGKALLKPSEIRNRTPGKRRQKDWGECPLTFDAIQHPVRAADGKVYERWAIEKWLKENSNRSPLTNVVIDPTLIPLSDSDEGIVKGERFVSSPKDQTGIKTKINTALNAARTRADANSTHNSDEDGFTDIPEPPLGLQVVSPEHAAAARSQQPQPGAEAGGSSALTREIAAILRDPAIPPAEKQSRIQALRAANGHPAASGPRSSLPRASPPVEEPESTPARSVSSPSAPKHMPPQPDPANGTHAHKPPRKTVSEPQLADPAASPKEHLPNGLQHPEGSLVPELLHTHATHPLPSKAAAALPSSPAPPAGAREALGNWRSSGPLPSQQRGPDPKAAGREQLARSNTFSDFGQEARAPQEALGEGKAGLVGIGVTFGQVPPERPHGGALYVKRLQDGGAAAQTSRVQAGDLLFEVDGVNVYRASVQTIQAKVLGPPRSQVAVTLKRARHPRMAGPAATPGGTLIPEEPLERLETVAVTLTRVPAPQQGGAAAGQPSRELLFDESGADRGARGGAGQGGQGAAGRAVYSAQGRAAALQGGPLGQTLEVEARKAAVALFGRESSAWVEMLAEGECVDLSFVCSDQRVVRAHRLLLAGSSPLLRRVLKAKNGQVTPAIHVQSAPGETQVTLLECRAWAVDRLVQFLYGGKLRVGGAAELAELYSVSRSVEVAALQEAAEDGLLELLTVDTCCDLLALADESGCARVLEACRRLAAEQFGGVARTGGWVGLAEAEVEALLQSEQLGAGDEEQVLHGAMRWMSHGMKERLAGGRPALRGERLAVHVRFAAMSPHHLLKLQQDPLVARSQKLRGLVEQGIAVQRSGASAQPRQGLRPVAAASGGGGSSRGHSSAGSPNLSAVAAAAGAGGRTLAFAFDPARSHANHLIRESGTLAVLREEGDSEHSALLSPAIPRSGRHFVEFVIENSGTPECYIQLGVCTGTHDVANGTPAYQSNTGWCFSCHNGNLLHFDQGSEYCSKLPRQGDRVGLLVDMDRRTLEVFVNSEGQGVMVRNLPETLHFVVDGGDKGQAIRIITTTSPVRT